MKYIAIIGFGVVGGGITSIIETNAEKIKKTVGDDVEVKYILDLRDFPDSPYADRVVHDITPILEDKDVELVCETMGGSHPAYEFSVQCMNAGKSVVTSNKEVVANFGDKLLECAAENGVSYLFEASVGGGIPVIRPFTTSLAGEKIVRISGIVNGTTNYILTKMKDEGREFGDVLAEAQQLGFAERDPSADIDGIDAKRKIIILTALASGVLLSDEDVYAETLRNVTPADIAAAEKFGGSLKLIADTIISDDSVKTYVCPMIVPSSCPLSFISDVYNGISVTSAISGDIMYYGRGAGRLPTAGAVTADIVAVLSGAAKAEYVPVFNKVDAGYAKPFDSIKFTYYIRANWGTAQIKEKLENWCDDISVLSSSGATVEIIAGEMTKAELEKALAGVDVESIIRVRT
ncbi:MAG: homoserine dehydrogenase [Ruminococcaceae bacterium]|nr:homoserine dehydrogenase [Oscillospiraceae bacterium]